MLVQQAVGLAGESWLVLSLPPGHAALWATGMRFIVFDGLGLALMLLAYVLLRRSLTGSGKQPEGNARVGQGFIASTGRGAGPEASPRPLPERLRWQHPPRASRAPTFALRRIATLKASGDGPVEATAGLGSSEVLRSRNAHRA